MSSPTWRKAGIIEAGPTKIPRGSREFLFLELVLSKLLFHPSEIFWVNVLYGNRADERERVAVNISDKDIELGNVFRQRFENEEASFSARDLSAFGRPEVSRDLALKDVETGNQTAFKCRRADPLGFLFRVAVYKYPEDFHGSLVEYAGISECAAKKI